MLRGKKKLTKKKNTNNTDDKIYIMPGMKHMKQDRRPVDGQDTLQTMQDKKMYQPKKSGIYMDREDGSLPQDRVAKYYQEANPKMEQEKKEETGPIPTIPMGSLGHTGRDIAAGGNEIIRAVNPYVKTAGDLVSSGIKAAGDFIKGFDDRAQPTSNIKRR